MHLAEKRRHTRFVVLSEVLIATVPELDVSTALLVECSSGGGVIHPSVPIRAGQKLAVRARFNDESVILRGVAVRTAKDHAELVAVRWHRGADPRADAALDAFLGGLDQDARVPPGRR
jgi:hypothetical protein